MEEEISKKKTRILKKKVNQDFEPVHNAEIDHSPKKEEYISQEPEIVDDIIDSSFEIENTKNKKELMNNLSSIKKRLRIIFESYLLTYKSLSTEKIFIFWTSVLIGLIFLILGFNKLSTGFLISVPSYGGSMNEGVVGVSRYVNPVLASSDTDKDISRLIYSGLLKRDTGGNIINDLASDVVESDDHLSYTVSINENARFHDGEKVKAEDVIFTISKIQDKNINSPLAIKFEGVEVEIMAENTLIFHLKRPYIYFKESLTFGILPKHIWQDISNEEFSLYEKNIEPIGSGPYKINNLVKENNLVKKYELISFDKYVSGRPYIDKVNIYIYQNEKDLSNAIKKGEIDSTSYLNSSSLNKINAREEYFIIKSELPNLFSLSFNPIKNKALSSSLTRSALELSIDKKELLEKVFHGYSQDVYYTENKNTNIKTEDLSREELNKISNNQNGTTIAKIDIAKALLEKNLSKQKIDMSSVVINITTADVEDLKLAAEEIANYWRSLGLTVNINVYSLGDINDIIKNRNFEVLLFGSIVEHDTDLFAYWHSSQRAYPGLNISDYASKNMDKNLEILKSSINTEEREKALLNIKNELEEELPAIPLYSNNLNYIYNKNIKNSSQKIIPDKIIDKSERFININNWYIYEEKIWRFSYKKILIEKLQNIIH